MSPTLEMDPTLGEPSRSGKTLDQMKQEDVNPNLSQAQFTTGAQTGQLAALPAGLGTAQAGGQMAALASGTMGMSKGGNPESTEGMPQDPNAALMSNADKGSKIPAVEPMKPFGHVTAADIASAHDRAAATGETSLYEMPRGPNPGGDQSGEAPVKKGKK